MDLQILAGVIYMHGSGNTKPRVVVVADGGESGRPPGRGPVSGSCCVEAGQWEVEFCDIVPCRLQACRVPSYLCLQQNCRVIHEPGWAEADLDTCDAVALRPCGPAPGWQ